MQVCKSPCKQCGQASAGKVSFREMLLDDLHTCTACRLELFCWPMAQHPWHTRAEWVGPDAGPPSRTVQISRCPHHRRDGNRLGEILKITVRAGSHLSAQGPVITSDCPRQTCSFSRDLQRCHLGLGPVAEFAFCII